MSGISSQARHASAGGRSRTASRLTLPASFPLPSVSTLVAAGDTMFDGRSDHYLAVGLSALHCIERALCGRVPRAILDIGCGWGRVTRMIRARFPDAGITVCDLDLPGLEFTAELTRAEALPSCDDLRELHLPGRYDLIWAGSLFTHISAEQSCGLLSVLAAALNIGGVIVASSHGPSIIPGLTQWSYGLQPAAAADVLDDYAEAGYGHRGYDGGEGYGISLTDEDWWRGAVAATGLRLTHYLARAWDDHQDMVVAETEARSSAAWAASPGEDAQYDDKRDARRRLAAYNPDLRQFDNAFYLANNPDVALAVASGVFSSAAQHYQQRGREEGRLPCQHPQSPSLAEQSILHAPAQFDETWYLQTNPDVGRAVEAGVFASGLDHFTRFGQSEGRLPAEGAEPGLSEAERRERVGQFWSAQPAAQAGWYWMAHPMVRARVNRLASGDPAVDAYNRFAILLRERGMVVPIPRAVSLGCGFGALERGLASEGIIAEIDAYDIAPGAIEEARRLAADAGLGGLRYHVADLETIDFPRGELDVVFAHSSVHHVERLEQLFAKVAAMLKPGGIFHLNEFVGPTRFQWTDAQMIAVNRFLEALPERLRRMPSGRLRPLQARPTIDSMIASDPSESVRSSDIIPVLRQYFDIVDLRETGGALLHLGLGEIAQNFDSDSSEDRAILEDFFAEEDAAMRDGVVGSDFAIITAVARN